MGVKFTHTHTDGTACYRITNGLGHKFRLDRVAIIDMGTTTYGAGYMPYSGHWYIYDLATGKEIGSLSRELWEASFERLVVGELQIDGEHKCVATRTEVA